MKPVRVMGTKMPVHSPIAGVKDRVCCKGLAAAQRCKKGWVIAVALA